MNKESIGVFDSGIGGLTTVKALKELLPCESILYFGDVAHLPYGDKSPDILKGYVEQITKFLISQNVKAIVVACNTASAVAIEIIKQVAGNTPVYEVISPAVNEAISQTIMPRIGVIGTKTTVSSHIYLMKILEKVPNAYVIEKATPILVPLIEEGWIDTEMCSLVIQAYMSDTGFKHIETLILGCTHYPLLKNHIQLYFDQNHEFPVKVIDSSNSVASIVKLSLSEKNLLNEGSPSYPDRFYVSDYTSSFQEIATRFFGKKIDLVKLTL